MTQIVYDADRYPLNGDRSDLVAQCRAALAAKGACVLEAFVPRTTAQAALADLEPVLSKAHYKEKHHSIYLGDPPGEYPPDHPRSFIARTSSATLAYDRIPRTGPLETLYRDEAFQGFLAEAFGYEALYPYADPLGALNALVYKPGAETGWHFDNADFVVTLMLRPAERGGAYLYAPFTRTDEDENYATVARFLAGDTDGLEDLHQTTGDLVLFRGHHTLHRVSPVEGGTSRVIAVFSYHPEPGKTLAEATRKTFYGRAA